MPTFHLPDDTPVVQFDPLLELSPFDLFRRLREGRAPRLVDVRPEDAPRLTLRGAERQPGLGWTPPDDLETVLFDDDGTLAVAAARRLRDCGCERVRALFGGLELYEFALDPQVVGEETFLISSATIEQA